MLSARLSSRAHVGGTAVSVNRRQRPAAVRAAGAVRVKAAKGDVKKVMLGPPNLPRERSPSLGSSGTPPGQFRIPRSVHIAQH